MSRRRKSTDTTPFDSMKLEGSLFVPELLERAASGEATFQKEADYAIPKGLKLHDEYGRAFRIATATWQSFAPQTARADLDAAAVTRAFAVDFLRQCLGYTDLTLCPAPLDANGQSEAPIQHSKSNIQNSAPRGFPVTAQALGGRLPVIIAPHHLGLDDPDPRFAIIGSGARKKSAHQLAQEFLNASTDSLWAIVTNGKTLRLLRDADTLTRPNFLEFDLETILRDDQHRYADFSALWRILHASRGGGFQPPSPSSQPSSFPSDCIWEKWKSEGQAQGLRVRNGLRNGVQEALLQLGNGFLKHPGNTALRESLVNGALTKEEYFQQLLRLIYRCLFLFCAEERELLHTPNSSPAARQAYATGYSLRRFRKRSLRQSAHDPHGDLWQSVCIVFRCLAHGQEKLALPALGGLFAETQCPDLDSAAITNRDLLTAMRELRWFLDPQSKKRSAIDYRNMGPEELGSVYESLLELIPTLDVPSRAFGFAGITDQGSTSGNARKTTGSYYTPDSLVQELIKSALDPVIAQKLADHPENPIEALLSITVCDPSCGSGHFLLAAARRLAEKLAELRAPDGAVRPDDYRHALREAASRCLYGVDINPMAVELCRVALWLETVDPGKPLGFLNHHIRHGNSLLGTTPDLIAAGLPDETFTAIEGDDKKACAELKKRNKAERTGFGPLFAKEEDSIREKLRQAATAIEAMDDSQPDALQKKEAAFLTNETAPETRHAKLLADLWCAAFVIKKRMANGEQRTVNSERRTANVEEASGSSFSIQSPLAAHHSPEPDLFGQLAAVPAPKATTSKAPRVKNQEQGTAVGITTATLRDYVQGKPLPDELESEVNQLASQYRFFHWHLAFPQVFDKGGFDCILGNPPWERVKLQEKEWFAERHPKIANAVNASARKHLIDELISEDPRLHGKFKDAVRQAVGESHIIRDGGLYPLCGGGDMNTYSIFAEKAYRIIKPTGRYGLVLPTGLVTLDSNKSFFAELMKTNRLCSFIGFDNEEKTIFPDIDNNLTFAAVVVGDTLGNRPVFCFNIRRFSQLNELDRFFELTDEDLSLLNPNTRTCPIFRSSNDANLVRHVYRRLPLVWRQGPVDSNLWSIRFLRMFDMANDSKLFKERHDLERQGAEKIKNKYCLREEEFSPLFEAKMIWHFEHRWAAFYDREMGDGRPSRKYVGWYGADYSDPDDLAFGRYWVSDQEIKARIGENRKFCMAFRDITNRDLERTAVFSFLPPLAVGHQAPVILFDSHSAAEQSCFMADRNSIISDFIVRNKLDGTHLTYFIFKQLPVLPPATYAQPCPWALHPQSTIHDPPSLRDWLLPRVLELTYTAWDLEAFAADCGWPGPPFRWDEERRFLLRCELDAAFFHLYLGSEDEWRQQPEALTRAFPTPRHAVSYIMDTFPIVKRKDEAKHGTYRTKETILQIYDTLAESMATGIAYQTVLDPVPASFRSTHPPQIPKIARNTPKEIDDIWQHFVVHFLREAGSEATLALFREAWHRFADLSRYQTELSAILSEEEFANWQRSNPVAYTRPGFHEFVSNLVGSNLLAYNESSQVISFTDDAFDGIVAEPWIQTEVSLSLRLLAQHPEVEKWLPKAMAQHPVRREVALREFLTAAS